MRLDQVPGVEVNGFVLEFELQSRKYPEQNRNYQLPVYSDIVDIITFTFPVNRKTLKIVKVSDKEVAVASRKDDYVLKFK
jgi:hypothetical protein